MQLGCARNIDDDDDDQIGVGLAMYTCNSDSK